MTVQRKPSDEHSKNKNNLKENCKGQTVGLTSRQVPIWNELAINEFCCVRQTFPVILCEAMSMSSFYQERRKLRSFKGKANIRFSFIHLLVRSLWVIAFY